MASRNSLGPTADQLEDYRDRFFMVDTDSDGRISQSELVTLIISLGHDPAEDELAMTFKRVDKQGCGTIDFDDFVSIVTHYEQDTDSKARIYPTQPECEIREAFRVFDTNGDGFISAAELRHGMMSLDETVTAEEVDEILKQADVDGDGQVNYEEFVKTLTFK